MLWSAAALFVVIYALAAAWVVAADGERPPPVTLELTEDGTGVIISGAVPDPDERQALVDAVGDATGALVVVAAVTVDPDAASIAPATDTAAVLAAELMVSGDG